MNDMESIVLDGHSLTIEQVVTVAHGEPGAPEVQLASEAAVRVNRAADAVQQLLAKGVVAYGITTGFGAFKDRVIPPDQVQQLQRNIIVSHAVGVGDPFDTATVRAIMLIRPTTLASGYSGIRLSTLQLLLDMLNEGIHPVIPENGSLGASGDLAPLAHMALVMIGMGEAEYKGEVIPGDKALARAGFQPASLVAKEGLALTNGTTIMCAVGTLETARAERISQNADIAGCLSLEALNGTPSAFDERIHRLRPFPRQQECASYLRSLIEDSDYTRGYDPTNVQDAYTLRCIPQVHGAVRDSIAYARWAMEIELNAVTDNPLIFVDDDTGEIEVISGGNFHGEPLAIAMDYLGLAMSEIGNIAERRIMRLTDEASNVHTLPAFLIKNGGLNSGFMIVQYTAAALATESKVLSHPASVDTIPSSANVEDHVSMGATAALKARSIATNVERILAIELMAAAQGLDFRKDVVGPEACLGRGTRHAYALIREHVPFIENDTVLYPYIQKMTELVQNGDIVQIVNEGL